ncbi:MAG: hypothetical protein IJV17_05885 [Prevotella sp.]|nr:hypothetical protein [Prevotella sp.]
MKVKKILYLLMATAGLLLTACSPDDHNLSKPDFESGDLVHGSAFSVTVDADNTVTLKSLLDDSYNCYWIQPNGRSQGNEVKFQLPFAGTYEVTFGVDTRGGVVYGAPYKFEITTNNMSLLEDPLYTYLTGGVGKSKKWVPVDKDYGVGQCTGPVMYCNPDDVLNDGSGDTNIGISHMKPNWDPGFQSWLIPESDPYMDSYMVFSLDDVNGCSMIEYRGEAGTKSASTGTTLSGKWNLNLSDKNHPTLSFTDTYSMHNTGFNEVCDNYTTDIIITELTPYMLQLATMRTNSEGSWWIIWNFIAEDVQNGTVEIPSGDVNYLTPTTPVLPEIDDLTTKLFTTDISGVEFVGAEMTYQVSQDAAYDWLWWNGGSSAWESVIKENYGTNWAPKWDEDAVAENELTLTKKGEYTYGEQTGTYTISDSKIVFDSEVSFFTVTGDERTIQVKGKEWQVFKCDPGSELVLGVADGKDANGNTNSYLVVNLTYKAVGGGETGPVIVPFDASKVNNYIEAGSYFRCQLYNPWGGGNDAIDPANVKLKKNQKVNVTVTLSGFTFSQPAKMVLCCNRGSEQSWETDCFNYSRAITVNGDGTYTVSWTNDTGSTVKWDDGASALTITMQYDGYATLPDEDYASHCMIESITIE